RIRVTPNPGQQPRVVDHPPLRVAQSHLLAQPQRDQARPDHVLHRLTQPKIRPQRKQRNQLRTANPHGRRQRRHGRSVRPRLKPGERPSRTHRGRTKAGPDQPTPPVALLARSKTLRLLLVGEQQQPWWVVAWLLRSKSALCP